MLAGFLVEFDVDAQQFLDRMLGKSLFIPPEIEGDDQFAKLGAIIPKMVETDRMIAQMIIKARQSMAQNGRKGMTDMKRLSDIGVIKFNEDRLAGAGRRRAKTAAGPSRILNGLTDQSGVVDEKVDIAADCFDPADKRQSRPEAGRQVSRDGRGRPAPGLASWKQGKA